MEFPEFYVKICAIAKMYGYDYSLDNMDSNECQLFKISKDPKTTKFGYTKTIVTMNIYRNNPEAWAMNVNNASMWYGYQSGFNEIKRRIIESGHCRVQKTS